MIRQCKEYLYQLHVNLKNSWVVPPSHTILFRSDLLHLQSCLKVQEFILDALSFKEQPSAARTFWEVLSKELVQLKLKEGGRRGMKIKVAAIRTWAGIGHLTYSPLQLPACTWNPSLTVSGAQVSALTWAAFWHGRVNRKRIWESRCKTGYKQGIDLLSEVTFLHSHFSKQNCMLRAFAYVLPRDLCDEVPISTSFSL